jgi:hypothetical protein
MSESIETQHVTLAELKAGIQLADPKAVLVIGAREGTPGGDPEGAYAIEVQLHAAGGTPLATERVRIVDPDTNQQIGTVAVTDANGIVRARVPEEKEYHFVPVGDDAVDHENPWAASGAAAAGQDHCLLFVMLADAGGAPLAGETVTVKDEAGAEHSARTDDEGCIRLVTDPGAYELLIRKNKFVAHTLFMSDLGDDPVPYRFTLG